VISLPREVVEDSLVLEKTCSEQSGRQAAELAEQIGRGYSRFAFPDQVHDSLRKLHRKISTAYAKRTSFAEVLRNIHEFRVSCDDWNSDGRELSIYALVPADYLPSQDSQSEDWSWSVDTVLGINQSMRPQELDLETLSKLIVVNAAGSNDSALVDLWWRWGERLRADLLDYSDDEVSVIEFEALSASDMTYERLLTTGGLTFSAWSLGYEPAESTDK
jgi:hypothetical protein